MDVFVEQFLLLMGLVLATCPPVFLDWSVFGSIADWSVFSSIAHGPSAGDFFLYMTCMYPPPHMTCMYGGLLLILGTCFIVRANRLCVFSNRTKHTPISNRTKHTPSSGRIALYQTEVRASQLN